jgi:hypothetical protein
MSHAPSKAPTTRPAVVLTAGDICPRFDLLDAATLEKVDIFGDSEAGHPMLLVFTGNGSRHLEAALAIADELGAATVRTFAIGPAELADKARPFRFLRDAENVIAGGLSLWPKGGLLALAANQHVLYAGADAGQALAALRAHAAVRIAGPAAPHPPVLLLPSLLSHGECQKLISVYTLRGNVFVEPGHGDKGMKSDYKMRIPDYGRDDRIDHYVMDADTGAFIDGLMQRRLFPEIRKAFQYRITRREPYRIACYAGERGGEMHGHRDNSAPTVAYRRFAMSITLSEGFEGGALRFPEYGLQEYRLGPGDAVVFSSSLLHEVMAVSGGRRLVLLAFLFGET